MTGLLSGRIDDRVVTLSSYVHRLGHIDLDDLDWRRRRYRRWAAYSQSKLANLMFAYEFARRLGAAGSPVKSLAAHPGYASTGLQSHTESSQDRIMAIGNRLIAQNADMGALPTLFAATVATLTSGRFVGPDGRLGLTGHPRVVDSSRASKDAAVAGRLWTLSEEMTGVSFP